jgi:hypothetical protein
MSAPALTALKHKGIAIRLLSSSGVVTGWLFEQSIRGAVLAPKFTIDSKGGLSSLSFHVPREDASLIEKNGIVELFFNGSRVVSGYVKTAPIESSADESLEITCGGFASRLSEQTITATWTSVDVGTIIAALSSYLAILGIAYDPSLISMSAFTVASYEANDTSLKTVIEDIIDIINVAYSTTEYRYSVDAARRLMIVPISSMLGNIFEGWAFQNPAIEDSYDDLVNALRVYRTLSGSSNTEFVALYTDADSIELNGRTEKKLVFSNYVDAATIAQIATAIFQRFANPLRIVSIEKMHISKALLAFGKYGINSKIREYNTRIFRSDNLDNYISAFSSDVALSEDATHVLTGNIALKCVLGALASGYIRIDLSPIKQFPTEINISLWMSSGAKIVLEAVSSLGDVVSKTIENATSEGQWKTVSIPIDLTLRVVAIDAEDYALSVSDGTNARALYGVLSSDNYLFDLSNIRIRWASVSTSIWIDNITVKTHEFSRATLPLKSASYYQENGALFCDAEFGSKDEDLADVVLDIAAEASTLTDIFAKA